MEKVNRRFGLACMTTTTAAAPAADLLLLPACLPACLLLLLLLSYCSHRSTRCIHVEFRPTFLAQTRPMLTSTRRCTHVTRPLCLLQVDVQISGQFMQLFLNFFSLIGTIVVLALSSKFVLVSLLPLGVIYVLCAK